MHSIKFVPLVRNSLAGSTNEVIQGLKNYSNSHLTPDSLNRNNVFATSNCVRNVPIYAQNNQNFCPQVEGSKYGKNVHFTQYQGKLDSYTPNENDHAHDVMRSLPQYQFSTFDLRSLESTLPPLDHTNSPPPLPGMDWSRVAPSAVAGSFIALSRQCRGVGLASPPHAGLIQALVAVLPHLSNYDLAESLKALTLWPNTEDNASSMQINSPTIDSNDRSSLGKQCRVSQNNSSNLLPKQYKASVFDKQYSDKNSTNCTTNNENYISNLQNKQLSSTQSYNSFVCSNFSNKMNDTNRSPQNNSSSPINEERNFTLLWTSLDHECSQRLQYQAFPLNDAFKICDLWYKLRLSRVGFFTKEMLVHYANQLEHMRPHMFVQFMFYVNLCRNIPYNLDKSKFEKFTLYKMINKISLDELGIVAMGLFKTQTFIKYDPLIDAIFTRMLTEDLSLMTDINKSAVLKLLRKTGHASRLDKVHSLLEAMYPQLPAMSLPAQLQLVLLGTSSLTFNSKVVAGVASSFSRNVASLRLKDIERLCLAMMLYNFVPEENKDILDRFCKQLRTKEKLEEAYKYPKSFISCLNYMAILKHMPMDLLSVALHPKMIEATQLNQNYADIGREVLELDCIVELELSDYRGNRLSPQKKNSLIDLYSGRNRLPRVVAFSDQTHQEKLTNVVEEKLQTLLGVEVSTTFILTHASLPDIVTCCDAAGNPVPVPPAYHRQDKRHHKLPTKGLLYTAVVIAGRNHYIRGTGRLRGQMEMKIRHLHRLGYAVVVVPFHEFSRHGLMHKLTVLDEHLVAEGKLRPDPTRVERVYARTREPNTSGSTTPNKKPPIASSRNASTASGCSGTTLDTSASTASGSTLDTSASTTLNKIYLDARLDNITINNCTSNDAILPCSGIMGTNIIGSGISYSFICDDENKENSSTSQESGNAPQLVPQKLCLNNNPEDLGIVDKQAMEKMLAGQG